MKMICPVCEKPLNTYCKHELGMYHVYYFDNTAGWYYKTRVWIEGHYVLTIKDKFVVFENEERIEKLLMLV